MGSAGVTGFGSILRCRGLPVTVPCWFVCPGRCRGGARGSPPGVLESCPLGSASRCVYGSGRGEQPAGVVYCFWGVLGRSWTFVQPTTGARQQLDIYPPGAPHSTHVRALVI